MCFISPKAYPLFNPNVKEVLGGAEVDLYFLATELAKDQNFAVSFITADYGQEKTEMVEGVSIIKSVNFKKNPLNGALRVWRAMRRVNADIYVLKTPSPGTPLAAFFCLLHNKVFVYRTAHEWECNGTYLRQHRLLGRAFSWSLHKARVVLTQNKIDKENLQQSIGVSSIAIPNGHRLPRLSRQRREIILWVGRSARFKRPGLFIDLAEKMPSERFTFVCQRATGDEDYDALVARAGEVENLQFIERVPFGEIDSYFQRAKVFINTSDSEGFPNTFIQACKCATPILSLNVNPDGLLTRYDCGICCEGDWQQLLSSLNSILSESRADQLGKNGRKYAEQNHDIEKIVERYKKLFIEVKEKARSALLQN